MAAAISSQTSPSSSMNVADEPAMWADLRGGLNEVYSRDNMSVARYMQLYNHVYGHCTAMSQNSGLVSAAPVRRPARRSHSSTDSPQSSDASGVFVGQALYTRVHDFFKTYVRRLFKNLVEKHDEEFLRCYADSWSDFRFSSKVVNGIFAYLNRHWVKREQEDGKYIHPVYTLALITWKEQLMSAEMGELHLKVTAGVLELVEAERRSQTINTQLVKRIVENYVELGVEDTRTKNDVAQKRDSGGETDNNALATRDSRLEVYREVFEKSLLERTDAFYTHEAEEFLNANSVCDYMKKVESRLREEHDRAARYLDISSQHPLTAVAEQVLVSRRLDLYQNEFPLLLNNWRVDDIARMYLLCERVENGLVELRTILQKHIERVGFEAVRAVAAQAAQDPRLYVHTLLDVHDKFAKLVSTAFNNDPGFIQALDKAANEVINRNEVTKKAPQRSAELLARYADLLLKRGGQAAKSVSTAAGPSSASTSQTDADHLLDNVMVIFKYVEDKDIFQKFYTKMFARRLIYDSSASDDAEATMLARLKQACGFEYTTKMQRMFTDRSLSKELTEAWYQWAEQNRQSIPIDLSVMVLGSGQWPAMPPVAMQIPSVLTACIESFTGFYQSRHSGRKLTWLPNQSRGEIVSGCFTRRYTFTASTLQMAILLQFNAGDSFTADALAQALEAKPDVVNPVIVSLLRTQLLMLNGALVDSPEGGAAAAGAGNDITFDPTANLSLNQTFVNKKIKIDLSKALVKQEQKPENQEVQRQVDDDRKMVIQAAIVRIMKTRKSMKHQQLMSEVLQQLSSRFKPKVPLIKKSIDVLIEKEYIRRDADDNDTYEYLA